MLTLQRTTAGRLLRTAVARPLSTTAVRAWATPTGRYTPPSSTSSTSSSRSDAARSAGAPVEDIDLVFDYPTQGQTSHQRERLEASGLDLHSAMPHHQAKSGMQGQGVPGASGMGSDMGATGNAMSRYGYIGLGALGLGGLYMMMRRQSTAPPGNMGQPGDLAAQKPAESKMESMVGRGR